MAQKLTFVSGENKSQIDFIMCRKTQIRQVQDCKVLPIECVAKQHRPVICKLKVKAKQGNPGWTAVKKIRWWKLSNKAFKEKFVEEAQEAIRNKELSWEVVSQAVREVGRKVVGETSGNSKIQKETWWWNEEVQEAVDYKREKKKERDGRWWSPGRGIQEWSRGKWQKLRERCMRTCIKS